MPALTDIRVLVKTNPATGETLGDYTMDTPQSIADKVGCARVLSSVWGNSDLDDRAHVLKLLIRLLKQQAEPLAKLISAETGKPLKEAYDADLASATGILSHVAKNGPRLLRDKPLPFDKSLLIGRWHAARRHARGVVAIISPWNYPFGIPISNIAQALMGGNCVVFKPSELVPGVGEALVECVELALQQCDFPKEIIQIIQGDGAVGEALISSDIDFAMFTGSTKTGRKVHTLMQARGKDASLELGGSDPMIILPGADMDAATSYALWGRFTNAGQTCAAVKRLYVPKDDEALIMNLLKDKIEQLSVGSPDDPRHHMGPLISDAQRKLITEQVNDAIQKGATVFTSAQALPEAGYFYPPTLLTNVPPDARVLTEEVFGPVLPVVPYVDHNEAIQFANQTEYGLTACVFGAPDNPMLNPIVSKLNAGIVLINDTGATNFAWCTVPWGGWKNSGPGWSHGEAGILNTTLCQTITTNHLFRIPALRKQPWFFSKFQSGSLALAQTVLNYFGTESLLEKCHWKLPMQIWKNRSDTKI